MVALAGLCGAAGCAAPRSDGGSRRAARWEALPCPEAASISALAAGAQAEDLLAGSGAGLYLSEDSAMTWRLRSPADWRVLSVLRTAAGALLVGTYRRGIQRSTDGGASWTPVGFERNVYVDAILETLPGRLFAAVARSVDDEPCGVFRSDDDGRTWVPTGLQRRHAYSLSAPSAGRLFAGTDDGSFRSLDGGASWSRVQALSSAAPLSDVVRAGELLCAGFAEPRHRAPGGGALCSQDSGASWAPLPGLPAETAVHALATRGEALFAATGDLQGRGGSGVYVSRGGEAWQPSGLQGYWVSALLSSPDGLLHAGSEGAGAFVSRDGGSTWEPCSAGIRDWSDAALAFDAAGQLFALSLRALWGFDEASAAWTCRELPPGAAPPTPWNFLRWLDGPLVLPGRGALFFSDDSGRSWRRSAIPGASQNVFALHASADGRLFAVIPGEGVFVLAQRGAPWARVAAPDDTHSVCVTPAGTLMALGARSLQRATAEGGWRPVGPAGRRAFSLESRGDVLYLASPPDGVLASRDDGRTWEPVSQALLATTTQPGYLGAHSLLSQADGGLLVATFSDGVVRLDPDGGWSDVTAGLPTPSAGDLALGPDGRVYLHTLTGVFRGTP